MHEDPIRAKKVCNLFKFIDDRNVINDGGKFENNLEVFILKSYNSVKKIQTRGIIFNLQIKIENGKFIAGLFAKREKFPN